jgi:hypothetical protein
MTTRSKTVMVDTATEVVALAETDVDGIALKLASDPSYNRHYPAQVKSPRLQQLLVAARMRELSAARLVKRAGKRRLYIDVGEVADTFYGALLLAQAGLGKKRVLDAAELDKLRAACAALKLTLPEVVEPTTAQRYFDDE